MTNYTTQEMAARIREVVLAYYNLPEHKVFSRRRDAELVLARQVMHYMARRFTRMGLRQIGITFPGGGQLHHSTIINSIVVVNDLMDTDERFCQEITDIFQQITGGAAIIVLEDGMTMKNRRKPKKTAARTEPMPKKIIRPLQPIQRETILSEADKVRERYL